jgi:hypothetical protein
MSATRFATRSMFDRLPEEPSTSTFSRGYDCCVSRASVVAHE